jgi:TatA/E family protein of Tat protein translocase
LPKRGIKSELEEADLEIIIILIIILILFGGWRLPKVSRSIGRTIGYLKKAATEKTGEEAKGKEKEPEKEKKDGNSS